MAGTAHTHHRPHHGAPAYLQYTRVLYTPTHHHTTHAQQGRQGTGHSKPASCYGPARASTAATATACTRLALIRYGKWQPKHRAAAPSGAGKRPAACAYAVRSALCGGTRAGGAAAPCVGLPRGTGRYGACGSGAVGRCGGLCGAGRGRWQVWAVRYGRWAVGQPGARGAGCGVAVVSTGGGGGDKNVKRGRGVGVGCPRTGAIFTAAVLPSRQE
jgi:hypothetical protein